MHNKYHYDIKQAILTNESSEFVVSAVAISCLSLTFSASSVEIAVSRSPFKVTFPP
jgi:hypothetical protein